MLNSYLGNLDKVPAYIDECKRLGIEILKPDINKSYSRFTVESGKNSFWTWKYKKCRTSSQLTNIVEERKENGEFTRFYRFL